MARRDILSILRAPLRFNGVRHALELGSKFQQRLACEHIGALFGKPQALACTLVKQSWVHFAVPRQPMLPVR
jgi:hypothetical protein